MRNFKLKKLVFSFTLLVVQYINVLGQDSYIKPIPEKEYISLPDEETSEELIVIERKLDDVIILADRLEKARQSLAKKFKEILTPYHLKTALQLNRLSGNQGLSVLLNSFEEENCVPVSIHAYKDQSGFLSWFWYSVFNVNDEKQLEENEKSIVLNLQYIDFPTEKHKLIFAGMNMVSTTLITDKYISEAMPTAINDFNESYSELKFSYPNEGPQQDYVETSLSEYASSIEASDKKEELCEEEENKDSDKINKFRVAIGDTIIKENKVAIVNNKLVLKVNTPFSSSLDSSKLQVLVKPEGETTTLTIPERGYVVFSSENGYELEIPNFKEGLYELTCEFEKRKEVLTFWVRKKKYDFACTVCGRDLEITYDRLREIFPNSSLVKGKDGSIYATNFNGCMKESGLNTCDGQAKIFAQIGHESGGFNATIEGQFDKSELKWSISSLLDYFKKTSGAKRKWFNQDFWDEKEYKKFITTNYYETASNSATHKSEVTTSYYGYYKGKAQEKYKVDIPTNFVEVDDEKAEEKAEYLVYTVPEKDKEINIKNIFIYAYGGSLGNKDPEDYPNTEDGYLYRGKGAIQLTGKDNYKLIQTALKTWFNISENIVDNPDLVATNDKVMVYSAMAFVLKKVSKISDIYEMTIDQVSALVNAGNKDVGIANINGGPDRKTRYNKLKKNEKLFNNCRYK